MNNGALVCLTGLVPALCLVIEGRAYGWILVANQILATAIALNLRGKKDMAILDWWYRPWGRG